MAELKSQCLTASLPQHLLQQQSFGSPLDLIRDGKSKREHAEELGISFSLPDRSFEKNQSAVFVDEKKEKSNVSTDEDKRSRIFHSSPKLKLNDFLADGMNDVSFTYAPTPVAVHGSFMSDLSPQMEAIVGNSLSLDKSWAFYNLLECNESLSMSNNNSFNVSSASSFNTAAATRFTKSSALYGNPNKVFLTINAKTAEILVANDLASQLFDVSCDELIGTLLTKYIRLEQTVVDAAEENVVTGRGEIQRVTGKVVDIIDGKGIPTTVSLWMSKKQTLSSGEPTCIVVLEPVAKFSAKVEFDVDGVILNCDQHFVQMIFGSGKSVDEVLVEGKSCNVKTFFPSLVIPGDSSHEIQVDINLTHQQVMCKTDNPEKNFPVSIELSPKSGTTTMCLSSSELCLSYEANISLFTSVSGLVTVLPEGRIHSINETFLQTVFGYSSSMIPADMIKGQSITKLIPDFYDEIGIIDMSSLPLPPDVNFNDDDVETTEDILDQATDFLRDIGERKKDNDGNHHHAVKCVPPKQPSPPKYKLLEKGEKIWSLSSPDESLWNAIKLENDAYLANNSGNTGTAAVKDGPENVIPTSDDTVPKNGNTDNVNVHEVISEHQPSSVGASDVRKKDSAGEKICAFADDNDNSIPPQTPPTSRGCEETSSPAVNRDNSTGSVENSLINLATSTPVSSSNKKMFYLTDSNEVGDAVAKKDQNRSSPLDSRRLFMNNNLNCDLYDKPDAIREGKYHGIGRRVDGSLIPIEYQIKEIQLAAGETDSLFCIWISRNFPDLSDSMMIMGGGDMVFEENAAEVIGDNRKQGNDVIEKEDDGEKRSKTETPDDAVVIDRLSALKIVESSLIKANATKESPPKSLLIADGKKSDHTAAASPKSLPLKQSSSSSPIPPEIAAKEEESGDLADQLLQSPPPQALQESFNTSLSELLKNLPYGHKSPVSNSTRVDDVPGYMWNKRPFSWQDTLTARQFWSQWASTLGAGTFSKNFTSISMIGKGAFGYVKLCERKTDNQTCVVKYIKKKKVSNWVRDRYFGRVPMEICILSRISHPSIVKVLEIHQSELFFQMVMEKFGDGMDLFEFVDRQPLLTEGLCSWIFRQLISAIKFLHERQILHRDVKDENIILNRTFDIRLIDFGSAAFMEPGRYFNTFCGTQEYCSPEVLTGNPYPGPELEMWSIGVTLYTLVFFEQPFANVHETLAGELHPPFQISEQLWDLIERLLCVDPKYRMTLYEAENHFWTKQPVNIADYIWEQVLPDHEFTGNTASDSRQDTGDIPTDELAEDYMASHHFGSSGSYLTPLPILPSSKSSSSFPSATALNGHKKRRERSPAVIRKLNGRPLRFKKKVGIRVLRKNHKRGEVGLLPPSSFSSSDESFGVIPMTRKPPMKQIISLERKLIPQSIQDEEEYGKNDFTVQMIEGCVQQQQEGEKIVPSSSEPREEIDFNFNWMQNFQDHLHSQRLDDLQTIRPGMLSSDGHHAKPIPPPQLGVKDDQITHELITVDHHNDDNYPVNSEHSGCYVGGISRSNSPADQPAVSSKSADAVTWQRILSPCYPTVPNDVDQKNIIDELQSINRNVQNISPSLMPVVTSLIPSPSLNFAAIDSNVAPFNDVATATELPHGGHHLSNVNNYGQSQIMINPLWYLTSNYDGGSFNDGRTM